MGTDNEVGIEFENIDFTRVLRDADAIGRVNPHRHEMKLLSAVVYTDTERHLVVGYADFAADAFWVRGHFPEFPVVPGVLMVEAAAQLVNYYTVGFGIVAGDKLMGLGGLENVRFRGMVRPGERLVIAARGLRVSSRITKFMVAGAVPRSGKFDPAFEAVVIGVPLGKLEDLARA